MVDPNNKEVGEIVVLVKPQIDVWIGSVPHGGDGVQGVQQDHGDRLQPQQAHQERARRIHSTINVMNKHVGYKPPAIS